MTDNRHENDRRTDDEAAADEATGEATATVDSEGNVSAMAGRQDPDTTTEDDDTDPDTGPDTDPDVDPAGRPEDVPAPPE